MRKLRFFIIPAALLALIAAGCGSSKAKLGTNDIAVAGKVSITRAQFNALMERAKQTYKSRGTPFPKQTSPAFQQLKGQAVQFLVQRAEFEQEAQKMGIQIKQKQVDDRIKQIRKTYYGGSQARFDKQLKQQHITLAVVKGDIRGQLVQQALYNKITSKVTVSPKEIRAYYESHHQQYQTPESRDVRHILVKNKALARRLYAELKANHGKNFAQLAKKYSKDTGSAKQGGKLTITKGQTVLAFDQTAFNLGTGTISVPIKTQYGYHIIQPLSPVRAAKTTPLKQVSESIKQILLSEKKQKAMTDWVNGLKKDYNPAYAPGYAPPSSQTQTTTTG